MRSNIFTLRQRKIDLRKSAEAMNTAAEGREMTTAEADNFAKTTKALQAIELAIIEEEKLMLEDRGQIGMPDENMAFAAMARGETPPDAPFIGKRKTIGRVGIKSWAELFGQPRGDGGFKSFAEYARAVRFSSQLFDPRLRMSMTEDQPSQGGFLVPEQWAAFILQYALENAICMSRCQVWPMTSETLKVPGVQDYDHSAGSLYGGVQEIWYDELQTLDDQYVKTRLVQLSAHKLGMLSNASSELTEDGPMFESVLTSSLQAAAQFFLDRAFFFGTGATKPLGMLDPGNPSLVVVAKNAATPTGGFLYEDATAMFTAMAPACRMRAEWVFTDELIPALMKMQLVVKNVAGDQNVGGSATPMFTMNSDGTGTLLGRPAHFSEKFKSAGTQGDAAFLCFDQYAIGVRRELQLRRSLEAGFANDSVYWRLTARIDGMPTWSQKLKLSNGNIVSPFVTLAART